MPDINENPVPRGPGDLCFNSNEFTRETFSVDHFLQDHRNKANLETMRDDLGIYLKVLRSAMIELINKDYTDFVNLSSNLIGLDKAIDSIQTPLGQLKEELLQVQLNLDEAMIEVTTLLQKQKKIQQKKQILRSLSRIQTSIKKLRNILNDSNLDPMLLERAAAEFNQLQFHVLKCENFLVAADKQIIEESGNSLMKRIDNKFISCFNSGGEEDLQSVLGIYLTLGCASAAENLYRKEVVSPTMKNLINEEALSSNPRGLQGLFDSILTFTNEDMKPLLHITGYAENRSPTLKGFEFLVNSFWPEVEERLEMNLTCIYAPGNPELFYQRYCESIEFIGKLEIQCGDQETIQKFKSHPNYISFFQRWNLPVYFQIRFQEIASDLEIAISQGKVIEPEDGWKLNVTYTTWKCLKKCWADKIYLQQLAHRFWKLNLQILARYYTWSGEILDKKVDIDNIQFLVSLYSDIESLGKRLPEIFDIVSGRLGNDISPQTSDLLKRSLDESKEQLLSRLNNVSSKVVRTISVESISALRQVSEVPRLFRRTNRETPVKALPYVSAILQPPVTFHNVNKSSVHVAKWLRHIFSDITKQYYTSVCDVLTSVQKTEESLRRLKKIRDRSGNIGMNTSTSERSGDDDKIKLQLYIDVNSYCNGVEELNIQRQEIEQLSSLLSLVETANPKTEIK